MEDAHNEDVGLDKTVGFVGSNNFMEMELGIRKKVNRENVKPKRFFYQRLWVCSLLQLTGHGLNINLPLKHINVVNSEEFYIVIIFFVK